MKSVNSGFLQLSIIAGILGGSPLLQADDFLIEEITVTARFKSESVQDIGAAISAIGADQMEALGISTAGDLAAFSPGLNMADRGPGRNDMSIRGIGKVIGFQDLAPVSQSVGVYLDDVAVNVAAGSQMDILFFDLDRVEVLRGPQGTLYGESSTGGTILYKTRDPNLTEVGGQIDVNVDAISGGGTEFGARAALNLPLVEDKVGLRLVANRTAMDGFIDNPTVGEKDLNDFETEHFRATLLAHLSDDLKFRLTAITEDRESGAPWIVSGDPSRKEFTTFDNSQDFINDEYELISARFDYDFGDYNFQSITGMYDRSIERELHDGVPAAYIASLTLPFGVVADGRSFDTTDYKQYTQEFRLVSQFEGPFNYTAGLFYKTYEQTIEGYATSDALLLFNPTNIVYDVYVYDSEAKQISAFTEFYYDISDQLTMTLGIRYHDEEIDVQSPPNDWVSFGLTLPAVDSTVKVDDFLPKFSLEYAMDNNTLIYGSVSKGLRNGNTNFTSTLGFAQLFGIDVAGKETYGEDEVLAYEVGSKMSFMDGALTVNTALFYNDWTDLQVSVTQATLSLIENVGSAHTMGFEVEANWMVNDNLTLFLNGNWIEAEIDEDFVVDLDSTPPGIASKGTEIPFTAEYTFAIGGQYQQELSSMDATFFVNSAYKYTGEYAIEFGSDATGTDKLGGFGILDLSMGIQTEQWLVTLRADNLLDNNEITSMVDYDSIATSTGGVLPAGVSYNENYTNRPRTLSLNVSYTF